MQHFPTTQNVNCAISIFDITQKNLKIKKRSKNRVKKQWGDCSYFLFIYFFFWGCVFVIFFLVLVLLKSAKESCWESEGRWNDWEKTKKGSHLEFWESQISYVLLHPWSDFFFSIFEKRSNFLVAKFATKTKISFRLRSQGPSFTTNKSATQSPLKSMNAFELGTAKLVWLLLFLFFWCWDIF